MIANRLEVVEALGGRASERVVANRWRPRFLVIGLFNGRNPVLSIEIKGMRAVIKAALPALDGLAVRFLTDMSKVTLDRPTSSTFRTWILEREVFQDINDCVGHIAVVIGATHVTTLSR